MILHRKIVSLNNIYMNEGNWLYTWQTYTVSKSRVEISHRFMETFLILKRLWDNLRKKSEKSTPKKPSLIMVKSHGFYRSLR